MATHARATALFRHRHAAAGRSTAVSSAAATSAVAPPPWSSRRRFVSGATAPTWPSPHPPTLSRSSCQHQPQRVSPLLPPSYGLRGRRLTTAHAVGHSTRSLSAAAGGGGGEGDGGEGAGSKDRETGPAIAIRSALRFKTIVDGKPMVPGDFEGKAVLVVNTASLCGLTPQLKELEMVHKRFQEEGLVVLGVPSNDFGGQEPWEEEKIKEFYAKDYGVTFPLTAKTVVVGPEAHPVYSAVVAEFGADVGPQWNFHKLLVGADGALAGVFGSNLSPLEPDVTEAIEEALPTKPEPTA
eukprot:g12708.t1